MFCRTCDSELTKRGSCPKCSLREEFHETEDNRRSRILWGIEHSAAKLGCDWTAVPDAVALAGEVGLDDAEISDLVAGYSFRHRKPLIELTPSENAAIERLSAAGLNVRHNEGGPFRHGFTIYKAVGIKGNTRPGMLWTFNHDDGKDESDAPLVWLYPNSSLQWIFCVSVYAGGPGPGDFEDVHDTLQSAASGVYEYFFGDPYKMTPHELAK